MIIFPEISPEIFSVDLFGLELSLRWYAMSYIVGFFCALWLMKYFLKRNHFWSNKMAPMDTNSADNLLTYLILGVILGGRLGYVIFYNFSFYLDSPLQILRVWDGGMSFHGGFLGVVAAVLLYSYIHKISIWLLSDLVAIASPPGLLFGRLANFVNAELWGKPTDLPWGVIFPGTLAQNCPGVEGLCARHPSQIYEAMLEGLVLFCVLFFLGHQKALTKPGLLTGVFAAGYGVTRYFVEFFRVPDPQFFSPENINGYAFTWHNFGITMGQALCLPMILIGLILVIRSFTFKEQ